MIESPSTKAGSTTASNLRELQLAVDRLLAGNSFRSNGNLTITSLMGEAGLPRPYSARSPYKEIVAWFKHQVSTREPAFENRSDDERQVELLTARVRDLKAELTTSLNLNKEMASKILLLTANVDALTSMLEAARDVRPISGSPLKRPGTSGSG
jgi:hypothetical protein